MYSDLPPIYYYLCNLKKFTYNAFRLINILTQTSLELPDLYSISYPSNNSWWNLTDEIEPK